MKWSTQFSTKMNLHKMSPAQILKEFLSSYIQKNNLDKSLEKEIPRKWEKYGDFVLFDERTFSSDIWKQQESDMWLKVAEILKCKRIALKNKIKNDEYRTPNVTILLGSDPWILHKDNSILYSWNVKKSMFSAGNAGEKLRIANLKCENEIVVDLFAGIGYFTLPFIIHSKAAHVHACEWNPEAVEALRRNLKLNRVENKCTVYEGDSRLTCPKKVSKRVNLGLIPTSQSHWKTACEALVDQGGFLHIHENVEKKKDEILCTDCYALSHVIINTERNIIMNSKKRLIEEGPRNIFWKHKQWLIKGVHILHSLISILSEIDSSKFSSCSIENINYIKSYAPHIDHLVFDVEIKFFNLNC